MTNKTFPDFFTNCQTLEELKKEYHKLVKKYHPDNGGDIEMMQDINYQFDIWHEELKNKHRTKDGTIYEKPNDETPEEFRDMIEKLLKYNLTIEVIGCFVWVSGDTKPAKEILKSLGFKWHSKKIMWYLAPKDYHKKSRHEVSMDEIREFYGVRATLHGKEEETQNRKQYSPVLTSFEYLPAM